MPRFQGKMKKFVLFLLCEQLGGHAPLRSPWLPISNWLLCAESQQVLLNSGQIATRMLSWFLCI
jgi:hypothetical protein